MEVKGRIAKVMPIVEGISERGAWQRQDFILEYFWWQNQTEATKMLLSVTGGDRIRQAGLHEGDEVTVRYYIEAHEYNGRLFNNVRCLGVDNPSRKKEEETAGTAENLAAPDNGQGTDVDDLPL